MLQRFLHYIEVQRLFSDSDKILLTVSGGMDSMVMTKLFDLAGLNFGIAHCNFKLRGPESDMDADLVRNFARNMGVEFFLKEFETLKFARLKGLSIQDAARKLRYQWFEELILQTEFKFYATAHHFDDQIETFFINLFRGTGVSGLRGILPKNGNCIRPLLFANRIEIEDFARKNKIDYREDSSNNSDNYLRNRIRHFILPALNETRPDFRKGFDLTFNNLSGTEGFIKSEINRITDELINCEEGFWKIDLDKLRLQNSLSFVLFELLKPFNFNYENVRMIIGSLSGVSGKTFYSPTHQILLDRDSLLVRKRTDIEGQNESDVFFITEDIHDLDNPFKLSMEQHLRSSDYFMNKSRSIAHLDVDKLKFPLEIRKPKTGDHFYPLGLGGKKKLSDFFTDEKFSAVQKQNTWLLISDGEIAWVIGQRLDDRFKITPETSKILKISVLSNQ